LYKSGKAISKPEVYAKGRLVMWTLKEDSFLSIDSLDAEGLEFIAIANPTLAPYGVAAVEVMKNKGVFEAVKGKFVYGESISQVNQFVISKTADVGFTSMSVVLSPGLRDKGKWIEIDEDNYSPIDQGVVIVKQGDSSQEDAEKFYRFLFSEKAKKILKDYGYFTTY